MSNQSTGNLIDKISRVSAISIKYLVPLAAGFYVGMKDGYNQEIESSTRYTLLTAPTVFDLGFTAIGLRGIRHLLRNPIKPLEELTTVKNLDQTTKEGVLKNLDELKDMNITGLVAKSGITTAVITSAGYFAGVLCGRLTQ